MSYRNTVYQLLRHAERYFKTDLVYLAKGSFWLVAGQISVALSGFALSVFFAQTLPQDIFGTYKYILSLLGIFSVTSLAGLNSSLLQSTAKGAEGEIRNVVWQKIKWGGLGAVASMGAGVYYLVAGNTTLGVPLCIAAIFLPFFDSFSVYLSYLQGKRNFRYSTFYGAVSHIVSAAVMITTLLFTKSIASLVVVYLTTWTLIRYAFYLRTLKKFPPNNTLNSNLIPYGKHLSFMNVLPLITQQIDKVILFQYLGPTALAVYTFAIAIPDQLKSPIKNLQTLLLPKFSIRDGNEVKQNLHSKIIHLTFGLTIVVVLYAFMAPLVYRLFFPAYLESILYSQVYALSILFGGSILTYSFLQAKEATHELYRYNIIRSIIEAILLLSLIRVYGLMGAIVAKILVEMSNFVLLWFFSKRFAPRQASETP